MSPLEENTSNANKAPAEAGNTAEREPTGLPWFRTWRSVYVFVLGCFILYVVLLAVFSRAFS